MRRLDQVAKSIRVLIQQGEKSIESCSSYNNQEKILLSDFISTLKVFYLQNDPVENLIYMDRLIKSIEIYLEKYFINNQLFFQYPFLWFTSTFLDTLKNMLLSEKESFSIMLLVLREFIPMLLKCKPLTDISSWEKIQNSSLKKVFTYIDGLFDNNLSILQALEEMRKKGIISVNNTRIYNTIKPYISKRPRNQSYEKLIKLFFDLTNFLWSIEFSYQSFDIEWFYLHLKLKKKEKLSDWINFPNNSVLDLSMIHKINDGNKNEFLGLISLPTGEKKTFTDFIDTLEKKGAIESWEINKIAKTSSTLSYNFYKPEKGWIYNSYPKPINPNSFSITEEPVINWNYKQEDNPLDFVKLFCKYNTFLTYSNLKTFIGDFTLREEKNKIFGSDNQKMFNIYEKEGISIKHLPLGLINSFSLKRYEITVPSQDHDQFQFLLTLLPYSEVHYLKNDSIKILTHLNDELYSLINKKLFYNLKPINFYYNDFKRAGLDYFDNESLKWKINL